MDDFFGKMKLQPERARPFADSRTAAYLSAAVCGVLSLWLLHDLSLSTHGQSFAVVEGAAISLLGIFGAVMLVRFHINASEDRYRRLVEMSPDGIMVHREGKIVFANAKLAEICGAESENEIIGTPAVNYVAPEERKRVAELRKQVALEGKATELSEGKILRLDGSTAHVERAGAAIRWKGMPAILVVVRDINQRKLTEEALKESERRYSGIAANIPGAIFQRVRHPDGRITFPYVSEGVRETHGVEAREAMAHPEVLLGTIHPEDRGSFDEMLAAALDNQEPVRFEVRNIKPDGETVWIQVTQRPQKRADGTVIWDGMFVDVTQQKQMEDALAKSEERYRRLLDLSPDAVYVHKLGRIILVNSAALKVFGAESADQIVGRDSLDLVHPDFQNLAYARQRGAAAEGTATVSMEQKRLRIDGTVFEAEVAATAIDWEGERGAIVVVRDITEKKQAQEQLRRAEELLRDAVESIPDGLLLFDRDDRLLIWNQRFIELYPELSRLMVPGTTAEEMCRERLRVGTVGDLDFPIEEYVQRRMEMRRNDNGAPFVHRHEDRWFRITERGTRDGGVVATTTDVTELKNAEIVQLAAKEEAELANRAKSEFLANMSHEIRTPMNGVLGMISVLLESDLTPDQRKHAEIIKESGTSLMSILNDILDLSKVEAGRIELEMLDFDLRDLLAAVEAIWRSRLESRGLTYTTEIGPEIETVLRSDPTRIRQILINLISNGAKFTENGGVTIRVSQARDEDGMLATRFEVTDTGIGVSPDVHHLIFSKFAQADTSTTRKYGGTGLGLAISRQLAELMDGETGFESAEGQGSTFWFTVKCAAGNPDHVTGNMSMWDVEAFQPKELIHSLDILVAEDNSVNQAVIRALLDKAGHRFKIVENGIEAINSVTANRYDIVLMDVQMPEMDGVSATKKIRNLPGDAAKVPIIALTANAMKGDRESYLEAGMSDYVSKPIEPNELLAAIARNRPAENQSRPVAWSDASVTTEKDDIPPVLDLAVLGTLTEAVGEDVLPGLIAGSIHEMRTILERILELGDGNDLDALRRAAHDMKSSSGGFGAARLQGIAKDLEWASRDNRPGDARELVKVIGAIGDEAFAMLEAHANTEGAGEGKRAVNE